MFGLSEKKQSAGFKTLPFIADTLD